MKNGLLSIGKMAEMNRVTISTLRLYDAMDLLKPRYVDAQTGYRYYSVQQNARLDMIAYMKELGMSLTEIADVLQKRDISLIEQILAQKNEQIHTQLRALRLRHNAVERAISAIERYRKSPTTGTIALEYIDRRHILGIPCAYNFYESDIRSYEHTLLRLRDALTDADVQQIHSYSVGTSIRQEDFQAGRFIADEIFIFVDKQVREAHKAVRPLDSGMYACIYLDSYDAEIDGARRLLAYCQAHHYALAGDYICEVMAEFNVFDSDSRNMFLRLQVPVKFDKN